MKYTSMKHTNNGWSNPEVVGSILTEVKRFLFTSCGSLIPLLGLAPSGLCMGSISTLIYTLNRVNSLFHHKMEAAQLSGYSASDSQSRVVRSDNYQY